MEQHATRETAMRAMQPRHASQIFVLHSDAESGIFCLGRMATTMMMMVSNLRVVCVAKKRQKSGSASAALCAKKVKRTKTPKEKPMRKSITNKSPPIAFSEFGWI
jgi:hypothetical protein